ncbi:MAG: hypothetical protein Q8Q12_03150 [bacterium]|nr:hypothetical protein [bacterium]
MKNSRRQLGFWLTGYKGKVVWDTSKPDGQPRRCLDTSRGKSLFGFEAKVPFGEGLKKTRSWFLKARHEKQPVIEQGHAASTPTTFWASIPQRLRHVKS